MRRPRAVVFDMDGLLVDSERMARSVLQAAAADCGFSLSDEVYLTLIGCGPEDADTMLSEHFGATFDVPAFRNRRKVRMRELVRAAPVPLKPGARELLEFVTKSEIPIGLATGSSRKDVRRRLGGLAELFRAVATRDDVARGKPNPDLYLAAAASLGVDPAECLAVEDSFSGVRAAASAGMTVLMVPDLAEPTPEVARLAAGVYGSLVEVREALEACRW
jgi:HAD superfamily hydrolase (TIGR01509 family)